ncbi:MAG TPA: phosphoenolpyruvate-utilizing N-terminal domain-containing protein, partial [Bacillota bacterium]
MRQGIPASPGIAIGRAYVLIKKEDLVIKKEITDPAAEKARFYQALAETKAHIGALIKAAHENGRKESAEIFAAHRQLLEDPDLIKTVDARIEQEKVNAEFALETTLNYYINLLNQTDNVYMKERVADLKDLGRQILHFLLGKKPLADIDLKEECIIVASELAPSDTSRLDPEKVQGFLTELGGPTSHTAIIARSLEIPAVVGMDGITAAVKDGDLLIV